MAVHPIIVGIGFLIAVVGSLVLMAYVAWKGSQPSTFFTEAVKSSYDVEVGNDDVDAYFDLKEKMMRQCGAFEDEPEEPNKWVSRMSQEEKMVLQKALVKRLVVTIEQLDRVQRDKPGTWKMWREKLVSERYWASFCETEKRVGEEIDRCVDESDELEPGWHEHIFRQAVQTWRMQKQRVVEKKSHKKELEQQKKQKEKEEKAKEMEKKKIIEDKEKQEKDAAKMMEQLLREEEKEKAAAKRKGAEKAKPKSSGKKK
eukprot:TRINITY_DN28726_c0_g1_i1.p1 TRINITY_DN28726_c0_g1~~TRINITY_DN28726_c0_g1_i1.p1  ORF type:complete len:257 (-),score=97.98 TRINITY_DN28726_c0_g1_i1:307-1077(-)